MKLKGIGFFLAACLAIIVLRETAAPSAEHLVDQVIKKNDS